MSKLYFYRSHLYRKKYLKFDSPSLQELLIQAAQNHNNAFAIFFASSPPAGLAAHALDAGYGGVSDTE
jgi:hypothetical protein